MQHEQPHHLFSFMLEYNHGAFHQLDGVQAIPEHRKIIVLVRGLTPQCSFLSPGYCRRFFLCHQGFGSREGSNKQSALPFAVMDQMPSLDHWLQSSLQKHLLLVTVSSFAVRPHHSLHTAGISAACFWLTSPEWWKQLMAQRKSKRKPETLLSFLHKVFWVVSHHPIKPTNPGHPGGQGFTAMQHILAPILPHFHLHPQIQSFFLPAALLPRCPAQDTIRKIICWLTALPGCPRLSWKTGVLGHLSVIWQNNEVSSEMHFKRLPGLADELPSGHKRILLTQNWAQQQREGIFLIKTTIKPGLRILSFAPFLDTSLLIAYWL